MKRISIIKKISEYFRQKKEDKQNKILDEKYKQLLSNQTKITRNENIKPEEYTRFKYLKDSANITFIAKNYPSLYDELKYFKDLLPIFKELNTHGKVYTIKVKVINRELLTQSGLLNETQNINLIIENDLYQYTKEEYLKEEIQLNKLIESIKNSTLSPYEKYLAIYNVVKQFKPYKESFNNKDESRNLRYILNNEYMVCVGFANLLKVLLDKVNIPSKVISVQISSLSPLSYINALDALLDENYIPQEPIYTIEGHERNLIKIDDDKYNIHGIYIADATWDNDLINDLYNNASTTFDKRKEASNLEVLNNYDLMLDFHNFEEYCLKINQYLKKQLRLHKNKPYINNVIEAYSNLYTNIMKILYVLDFKQYQYFDNKYHNILQTAKLDLKGIKITLNEFENIYSDFLTEYAYYVLPLSNNTIDIETKYKAASNIKKTINRYDTTKIQEWNKQTRYINETQEEISFPFKYNNSPINHHIFKRKRQLN